MFTSGIVQLVVRIRPKEWMKIYLLSRKIFIFPGADTGIFSSQPWYSHPLLQISKSLCLPVL
jgi:hypothetical protein